MDEDELLCSDCNGSGEGRFEGNCTTCKGRGVLYHKECHYCGNEIYGILPKNIMEECSKKCFEMAKAEANDDGRI